MTRRFLLTLLTAVVTDPERLLWTPGKRLISIPAPKLTLQCNGVVYMAKEGVITMIGWHGMGAHGFTGMWYKPAPTQFDART